MTIPDNEVRKDWDSLSIEEKFTRRFGYVPQDQGELFLREIEDLRKADREALKEKVGKKKSEMNLKAMVQMGDLSFGNFTPTQIYVRALDDVLKLLAE